jgi:cytochrome oxidase assembly protein ShyY1
VSRGAPIWRLPRIIAGTGRGGVTRRRNLVIGWALAVLAAALIQRAGFWQLDRMHEKQGMLAAVATVLHERHAVPLAAAADPARQRDYDWSAGPGRFAALPAVLLDNQGRNDRSGVRAYRVFEPASGPPLLVELGWLPLPGDRSMPAVPLPSTVEHVAGLLAPPPSAGLARGVPVPACSPRLPHCGSGASRDALLVIAIDTKLLAPALHLPTLAPRVLKLDPAQVLPSPGATAYARDLNILPNTLPPQRHLGYAVQWFGLAATVLVTALVLTFRKRSPRA